MTHLVLVPLGDRFLGLTGDEFKAASSTARATSTCSATSPRPRMATQPQRAADAPC
jgi:hypothetical protein